MPLYNQAVSAIKDALTFGIEPSLKGITALTQHLGDPQDSFQSIQIAGTNGKSSTARFAAAFLHAQGAKVGLYTSPELIDYPERMEINGAVVSRESFAEAVLAADEAAKALVALGTCEHITEFELLTAAALWLFAKEEVDFAVLEVGMGGRWDATSVVTPKVAMITGIDLDHTHILGDTVELIAAEKAAIIKSPSIPVLGEGTKNTREVFYARCAEVGAPAPILVEDFPLPENLDTARFPNYQKQNIACAVAATHAALEADAISVGNGSKPFQNTTPKTLNTQAIQTALNTISLPGRFELIRKHPALLIDAAHNPQSASTLATSLKECYGTDPQTGRVAAFDTLLLGVLADKDAEGIITALAPLFNNIAVTQSSSPRAIPAEELAQMVKRLDKDTRDPQVYPTVAEALEALTEKGTSTVATGSITLAGEVKAAKTFRFW